MRSRPGASPVNIKAPSPSALTASAPISGPNTVPAPTVLAGWLHAITLPFTLAPFVYYGVRALWPLDRPALARLTALVATGRLEPQIDLVSSWRDAPAAFQALLDRRVAGKAVLTMD